MSLDPKAPDFKHQELCLQFLRNVLDVSAALATRTYIWGGMVVDILRGEFVRAHHDIDGFTLDLLDVRDQMATGFADRGYAASYAGEWDILRIDRGGLHAAFSRLEVAGNTAMWRHVGDQGTIFFPTLG